MKNPSLGEQYERAYQAVLVPIAGQLEHLVRDHLQGVPRIDRVSARAKSPDRFVAKAGKTQPDGSPRYSDPLNQIQDKVGARVVVHYPQDVEAAAKGVLKYFRPIEMRSVVPDSEWTFGYFGRHFILVLPPEAVPKDIPTDAAPTFFELQVKTLFQHAWSEAEHDLGYKSAEQLTADQQRRLAFTAAQAWGADRTFKDLFNELAAKPDKG